LGSDSGIRQVLGQVLGESGVDFAQQQRNPAKHLVGISIVILMHIILIYALVTGLARKVVEVIKQPLETKIIEEIKEKPPDEPPPPPPKLVVPPPPFIPPPEVNIQAPAQAGPTISTVTNVKPVAAPPPPKPVEAPKPRIRKGVTPIFRVQPAFPRKATNDGVEGTVIAHMYVAPDGHVTEVKIIKQTRNGYFEKAVTEALMQWKFQPEESDYIVEVPIDFKFD
jgi:protein TonB